ncbi:hypothetical protein [Thorsellia kenyensis]|uniref:Uncharacterized protein n=1 Tax=Thorsellia kenyensis TaxID=1549888 RepID=A0ABV6C8H6_9GAMM
MVSKLNVIKKSTLFISASIYLLGSTVVYSQDEKESTQKTEQTQNALMMTYPMNTLMLESIFDLVPSVAKQRDDEMMQLLCKLARKEITKEESLALLSEKEGWAPKTLPSPDHEFYLWVSDDFASQQTACAAYIATSLYTEPDNKEFIVNVKEDNSIEIDNAKFNEVMKIRLAIAKSNAHTFNAIGNLIKQAEILSKDKITSIPAKEIYKEIIKQQFSQIAPYYLSQIKLFYTEQTADLTLVSLNSSDYAIQNNNGEYLSYRNGELTYRVFGVDWLGNGKIMGTEQFIGVAYY